MSDEPFRDPGRRTPAKGVHLMPGRPNWVFLTVCGKDRNPRLAKDVVQTALHTIWKNEATAWLVSDYILMPDHLHLFCAPFDLECSIERWICFWKERFAKRQKVKGSFQAGGFHHRLRDGENYTEKWQYAWVNPVRAGLVARPEDWPYWGRVHEIQWTG